MPVLHDEAAEAERARQFAALILHDAPSPEPGVYVDQGIGGTIVYTVVGHDGKRLVECRVAREVATGEILSALRSWAVRYVKPPLEVMKQA